MNRNKATTITGHSGRGIFGMPSALLLYATAFLHTSFAVSRCAPLVLTGVVFVKDNQAHKALRKGQYPIKTSAAISAVQARFLKAKMHRFMFIEAMLSQS